MWKTMVNGWALLALSTSVGFEAVAQERAETPFTVFVYNRASVPGEILENAQTMAGAILERARVWAVWFDGGRASADRIIGAAWEDADPRRRLVIHLVPRSAFPGGRFTAENLGFAAMGSGVAPTQAYVFYDQVVRAAVAFECETDLLLGYSLAHEIGHLLLGVQSHTATGIMRGAWRVRDIKAGQRGGFGFSEEEVRRLALKIRERTASPPEYFALVEPRQ